MRYRLAGLAFWIFTKLKGYEMMAMLFACRVVEEWIQFSAVPRLLKR